MFKRIREFFSKSSSNENEETFTTRNRDLTSSEDLEGKIIILKNKRTGDEIARFPFEETTDPIDPVDPIDGMIKGNEFVLSQRISELNGQVTDSKMLMKGNNKRSWASVEMPELDFQPSNPESDSNTFIITTKLSGWDDVPLNDPNIRLFLFTPGDYVSWGVLPINKSGESNKRDVYRYYDPSKGYEDTHAIELFNQGRAAIIEGLTYGTKKGANPNPVSFLTVHGLSFIGRGGSKNGITYGLGVIGTPGSSDVTIDFCYEYRSGGTRLLGDRISYQNNCSLGRVPVKGDIGGIGVYTTPDFGSYDCRIVGNEVDHTDGIGLPRDGSDDSTYKTVDGTWIVDNDIYNGDDSISMENGEFRACGGEAIDVKNGSSDKNKPVIIGYNRIWNTFPTPPNGCGDNTGSSGGGMVLHKFFSNAVVINNVIFNSTYGIDVQSGDAKKGRSTADIAVLNNLIVNLVTYVLNNNGREAITGRGLRLNSKTSDAFYNTFINNNLAIVTDKSNTNPRDIYGNRIINTSKSYEGADKLVTVEGDTTLDKSDIAMRELKIEIKRWSKPETITIPSAVIDMSDIERIQTTYTDSTVSDKLKTKWYADWIDFGK